MQIMQSRKFVQLRRAIVWTTQSCGPAQPCIPSGCVARIARPLTCGRPFTHMLPVSLKMLLPPSPRPLSSLDELDPLLSDSLLDPDPDPFELPGIIRP